MFEPVKMSFVDCKRYFTSDFFSDFCATQYALTLDWKILEIKKYVPVHVYTHYWWQKLNFLCLSMSSQYVYSENYLEEAGSLESQISRM